MPDMPLAAHSLAEAHLYLMATPCAACAKGPQQGGEASIAEESPSSSVAAVPVTCQSCGAATTLRFRLPAPPVAVSADRPPDINSTPDPSLILDVGQWIVLFRLIAEEAGRETDKARSRRLGLEAAQCLEEAIKFYNEEGNDLPPKNAFFFPASWERFQQAPAQFSKRRLIGLRAKLPSIAAMKSRIAQPPKRRWWPW